MNALAPTSFPTRAVIALYLREAKYEFLRLLRTPAFAMPTLVFPPMFYLLFGGAAQPRQRRCQPVT